MANSIQELDDALTELETAADAADAADQAAEAEILAAVQDIASKVGGTTDVSAELARVQAAMQQRTAASAGLRTAAEAVKALDLPPPPAGRKP